MYILFVTYFDRYALCIFMQFFRAKSLDSLAINYTSRHKQRSHETPAQK